jgi:hypothetical protein
MTNSTAEYRESLAAAGAPEPVPPRRVALVAPLAANLRPAREAAAEPESQRAARLEQDSARALPKLSLEPAEGSALPA